MPKHESGFAMHKGKDEGKEMSRQGKQTAWEQVLQQLWDRGFWEAESCPENRRKGQWHIMHPANSLIFKKPIKHKFMRGNRSAEQANEMCVIGHHRKESTATQGHPFSINRVNVVLFLLLQKVKSSVQWSQISDERDLWPSFTVLRNWSGKYPLCFEDVLSSQVNWNHWS